MSKLQIASDFTLDTARFTDEGLRVGIFASPGAGKGYLLGVLLEELIEAGYPCVMVDPESELWTFREIGALVIGGPHGHVPFSLGAGEAIEQALRFCLESTTPLVFDLGELEDDTAIRAGFEAVARPYWKIVSKERHPSVFALTEAHVFAPEAKPAGERVSTTLPAILTRGRKRGASVLLETQRISDIAKSVISHCNVRFVGRIDFEDDVKRVIKGLPGVTIPEVQALERGSFYVPRLAEGPISVRARRVTHGAVTPGQGEVTLRREEAPGAVAEIAERLAALVGPAEEPAPGRVVRKTVEGLPPEVAKRLERDADRFRRELEKAKAERTRLEARAQDAELRAHDAETLVEKVDALRVAIADLFGGFGNGGGEGIGYPGDEHVKRLIAAHAPVGGGVVLQPVEKLRADYLEQSAQRLVEVVRGLEPDEREALLFLIGQGTFVTINAVAKAMSGNDAGSTRQRWGKALGALASKGLVVVGGTGRMGRKADVEGWAARSLAPHAPSESEIADLRDRALYVLQEGS